MRSKSVGMSVHRTLNSGNWCRLGQWAEGIWFGSRWQIAENNRGVTTTGAGANPAGSLRARLVELWYVDCAHVGFDSLPDGVIGMVVVMPSLCPQHRGWLKDYSTLAR